MTEAPGPVPDSAMPDDAKVDSGTPPEQFEQLALQERDCPSDNPIAYDVNRPDVMAMLALERRPPSVPASVMNLLCPSISV